MQTPDVHSLFEKLRTGDTAALAKAITLVESTSPKHQQAASELLDLSLKTSSNAIRVGITGVPGVGKSTFIDSFGAYLIEKHNKKVAVLTIDPSSQQTRGSILGDKTRMVNLSSSNQAFIRPSPSGDSLGGVASQTREAILLCESAGFDVVLVETVGVGQSETLVHNMVDFFLLLLLPGAGDELQGIKRGIVEMADGIAINKSDTNPKLAKEALLHYKNALQLVPTVRKDWKPSVALTDAITLKNMDGIWQMISEFKISQINNHQFEATRKQQAMKWFEKQSKTVLLNRFAEVFEDVSNETSLADKVANGEISPRSAAIQLVEDWLKRK